MKDDVLSHSYATFIARRMDEEKAGSGIALHLNLLNAFDHVGCILRLPARYRHVCVGVDTYELEVVA